MRTKLRLHSHFPILFALLLALASSGLGQQTESAPSPTTEDGKKGEAGSWYNNKWYASDTVYIDGDGNSQRSGASLSADEGSGRGIGLVDQEGSADGNPDWSAQTHPGPSVDDEDTTLFDGSGAGRRTEASPPASTRKPWSPSQSDDEDVVVEGSDENLSGNWGLVPSSTRRPEFEATTSRTWWQPAEVPSVPSISASWPTPSTTPQIRVLVEERSTTTTNVPPPPPVTTTHPGETEATPDPAIYEEAKPSPFDPFLRPGILAAVIGGAVVGLLAAILLVMFIVYRMRKKDEGSYALEEPKSLPPATYPYAYQKAPTKEFYA